MTLDVHRLGAMRKRRRPRRRPAPVEVIRVDPLVMALALEKANGDARRIEIVDETTVIVRNI